MDFTIVTPHTRTDLMTEIERAKNFRFAAGFTDVLMEFKKTPPHGLTVINLSQLHDDDFNSISNDQSGLKIGALVTASGIIGNKYILEKLPVLFQAARTLASNQVRNVATIGGNLCTASPSGDLACALMALKASCEILSPDGSIKEVPVSKFFTGVRKTVLNNGDLLVKISIPVNTQETNYSGFIKIGTRLSMECSVVSLAYHFEMDRRRIKNAGIAIGSAAPTVKFASSACDYIENQLVDDIDGEEFANKVLSHATPISDIRGSAWYRENVLFNISKNLIEELWKLKN
jgi:CO/xanthine dehydrogenase FAD-binding subunit